MKTNLQSIPAVEGQNRAGAPRTLHLGLDVHNDSIAISSAPSDRTEVRRWGLTGGA